MGAEVTLLSGVILWIDEDGVVGAGSHAGLATDADGLVEVDDTIISLIHRAGRTGSNTRWIGTLIAPRHLKVATHLWKGSNFNRLDVGSRHPQRYIVFRFTGRRAGVASDALRLIEYLDPRLCQLLRFG